MVTDVYPIETDVYPIVVEESSIVKPQKVAKINQNIRKMQKRWVGKTTFAKELPDGNFAVGDQHFIRYLTDATDGTLKSVDDTDDYR
jgi:hypothetical protein